MYSDSTCTHFTVNPHKYDNLTNNIYGNYGNDSNYGN